MIFGVQAQKRVLRKWDRFLAGGPLTASEDADDKVSMYIFFHCTY